VIDPGTPEEQVLASKTTYIPLRRGALIELRSAGGGGNGDPIRRDRRAIEADLRDGYVTEAAARAAYGAADHS
jgi:N-methylhydantoinase B/oxoprolinase/acetone carboxylase alpha subunit